MDQLKKLFLSLSLKQRISLGVAALGVIAGLLAFSHWNRERDFKPVYSGLAQEDAAAVLGKIRESGTEFRLAEDGSAVLVPSSKVTELRLQLASAGLPKSGRIGFELFDKTNFGNSDFTEQINYHRAIEGELERTIMALSEVEQARVHVTFPKDSVFTESRLPAKASVLIKLKTGGRLSPPNVAAICQLTASAVEGLAPESVSVVDMHGNLLSHARKPLSPDSTEPDDAMLEYKARIERDLLAKINNTLEPLLGSDKFRVGASVECDFTSGEQSEETFDPAKSVMVTSQKTEDTSTPNSASGVPGTPSNLPRPTGRAGSGGTNVARRTESISYQSSRVVKKMRLPQGGLRRQSVSILLDQKVRFEGQGPKAKRIFVPPSAEQMKSIHDLVAGVIGFSAERGDQLVVETMPFESTLNAMPEPPETAPAKPPAAAPNQPPAFLQNKLTLEIAAGALVLLLAGFWFIRKRSRASKLKIPAAIEPSKEDQQLLTAEELQRKMEGQLAENQAARELKELEALTSLKLPPVPTKKTEVLTRHITEEAKKDPKVMAQIIRAWIADTGR